MGRTLAEIVVNALDIAAIPTQRAMPAVPMAAVTELCAAVQVYRLDQDAKRETVLVLVLSPVHLGAGACEDGALRISRRLQEIGGECLQEKTQYRSDMDIFCTEIYATFKGQETAQGWQAPQQPMTFTVSVGGVALGYATSFEAQRAVEEEVPDIRDALWHFRLEELYPMGAGEPAWPGESFTISVSRPGKTESYTGCVLTSHRRSLTKDGQLQIREGTAQNRAG